MQNKKKIIRSSTIPISLKTFLNGSIEPLMDKYDLTLVSSPEKELDELHEIYGVKTIGVYMERHISLVKDLKALYSLIKVFKKEKPFMVHSMTPKAGLLCMMAAWFTRVPKRVHTFTGLVWPTSVGLQRKILILTDKILCACATHIIPEGEGVKSDLQREITNKPMKVLGYGNVRGIDMDYWKITPDITTSASEIRDDSKFTFLFVGRLVGDKGINELVDAFCKLCEKHPQARLLLVGPAEENLDPLKKETWDKIKATQQIVEIGPAWGKDLLKYYAASDCFVFPSYREGFPNTVIEAGAMGLPSIVTDINGSREIIIEGQNGLIIPSKNTNALYDSMSKMIEDNGMRETMSKNSRTLIENRFEQGFVRKCLFDFYDEIMAE